MLREAEMSLFQNNSSRVENGSIAFVSGGGSLTRPINHNPTHFGFTDSCNYFFQLDITPACDLVFIFQVKDLEVTCPADCKIRNEIIPYVRSY